MIIKGTLLLAADTSRTNAYAQALKARGIVLEFGILYSDKGSSKPGQSCSVPCCDWPDSPIFLPDLNTSVSNSLDHACENILSVEAGHVNDAAISRKIKELNPSLIIYSGYGSQIVGGHLLSGSAPFLHVHSGWLPDFRGSTTVYYHLLENEDCGVSAIFLEKEIDTGLIVARKRYPKPPANLNIDYVYDCAIRADLLCDVLEYYRSYNEFPLQIKQYLDKGNTYFIIHPVLKHIAILSLK